MYKAVFSLRWRLRGFPAFGPDHWPRTSPDDVVGCLSFDPGKTMENLRERGGHRNQELQHQEFQKSSNQQAENSCAQPSHHGALGFMVPPGRFSVLSLRLLRLVRRIYWLPRESKATMASFGLLPGVVFLSLGGDPWPKDAKATWGCAQLVDDVSNVSRHQLAAGCKHSFFIPGMMILIDFTNFSGGETTKRRVSRHIKTKR